jgi:cellulose synthase/poly-beta-1,6-N-acetylglucosamine synthase-like glycosyltransferase/peptidoglycan/xylan/chitin deacetylase (PgdA/CDA1 family)/spore germination protein YaaH
MAVFLDPTGRRWRRVQRTALAVGIVTTALVAYVLVGILVPPALPTWAMPRALASVARARRATDTVARDRARSQLLSSLRAPDRTPVPVVKHVANRTPGRTAASRSVAAPIHAAFYVNWDDDAWQSLQQHIGQLDWVVAEWGFLRTRDLTLDVKVDPRVLQLVAAQPAASRPHVLAMLTNVDSGGATFSGSRIAALAGSPRARDRLVHTADSLVATLGLGGVVVDFEQVPPAARANVDELLRALATAMHARHATLAVTVAADEDDEAIRQWGESADMTIAMLYDEHSAQNDAGPVASQRWYRAAAERMVQLVPPSRLIFAFGTFGYAWSDAVPAEKVEAMTYTEAVAEARDHGVLPQWNADALEPTIAWTDADSTDHVIWFLDAATSWNAIHTGTALGVAGQAVWRLGAEDPALWRIFGHGTREEAWWELSNQPPGYGVAMHGDGELLRVTSHPTPGLRQLTHDSVSDLITTEKTVALPTAWTVERSGAAYPHRVALTFDDGPDGTWTPMILDTLRARHAPATFFVIGDRVQTQLGLTRRIAREGHALGSHTFTHPDLSRVSPFVTRLELDATARLLEAVVGERTLLFRPPYFGDAEPSTIDELVPVEEATSLGYITAGVHVDSDDWQRLPAAEIVKRVLEDRQRGHIVLLHDGGGDRAATVAAIGPIIDSLRARGDTIVPLAGLVGAAPEAFTPPLSADGARRRWLAFTGYSLVSGTEWLAVAVLGTGVTLGVLRLVLLMVLAIRQRLRSHRASNAAELAAFAPSVSVIVPAYKEQAVIVQTVHSLLQQAYAGPLEVIVVDDGSPDDTYQIARNTFAGDPRVLVVTKPNGGKASALNAGIALAHGDILVGLDADTVFAPDAIARLVQPLRDERVGAVAGNAKVGNRLNLVTRWQAVEYITSQNVDRRAFADLNAITVVPGAIGAWRATAVREAGGFSDDTLAEDQDLTIALRRNGWRIAYADDAVAYTEAPDTLRTLAKQRFRWAFGTLQCAWKHRDTLLRPRYGTLGLIAMPNTWIFQLLFTALSPLADVLFVWSFVHVLLVARTHGATYARTDLEQLLTFYAVFVLSELLAALVALFMEPREDRRLAWLVALQRFAYRQVMYWVVLRSIKAAFRGRLVGWGTLERKATVATTQLATVLLGAVLLGVAAPRLSAQPAPAAVRALPVTEVPAATGKTLALFWSGDGNWKELTVEVSNALAVRGVAVVGVGSRAWLTSGSDKSVADLTRDSEALLRWYLAHWHKERILLVGFSRGAGFSALLYERLPADLRERVDGIALLGAEHTASFEFHLIDLVKNVSRPSDILVKPYLDRITTTRILCVYGSTESDTVCPELDPKRVQLDRREGDHHFDKNYDAIAERIAGLRAEARP